MLVLSLAPVFSLSALGAALVALVSVLFHSKPTVVQPHDPDREYRRLQFKVRHPWKARLARWTGVD